MDTQNIVIVSAKRTPIGAFNGAFSSLKAHELGKIAIDSVLAEANLSPDHIDEVVFGQVLSAGTGQNPVRQAAIAAGIPYASTAVQINQLCGSGLRSVAMGWQSLALSQANMVIVGGQESMSQAPHFVHLRRGQKMGETTLHDSMLIDGLICAFGEYPMGITAENMAKQWQISREEQDEFSLHSQHKAEYAIKNGHFKQEVTPVTLHSRKGETVVDIDEFPRFGVSINDLAKLRPAFQKEGSVSAGNASGINDGAAALILMRSETAKRLGLSPMARIVSWATAGVDPAIMGSGPIPASRLALSKAGWQVHDLERIEANEAFAAQAIAVNREMGWDVKRVNPDGGAIALGHPIGASGARVLTTLLHGLRRNDQTCGLATLCIGGGMGIAMTVEMI